MKAEKSQALQMGIVLGQLSEHSIYLRKHRDSFLSNKGYNHLKDEKILKLQRLCCTFCLQQSTYLV